MKQITNKEQDKISIYFQSSCAILYFAREMIPRNTCRRLCA